MITTRRRIDWEAVRVRLKESEIALGRAQAADSQRIEAVYRRRAAQLAGRPAQTEAAATLPTLVFHLGAERYGIELTALAEALPFSNCAPVPGGPAELLGVINVRGEIRRVADLGRILNLSNGETGVSGYVLLLRERKDRVGLRVGRIEGVQQVSPVDLVVVEEEGAGRPARYVRGLTPGMLRVLDPEAILSHPIFQEASPR